MSTYEMKIDGMMCGVCEAHIKDAIRKSFPEAKHLRASHGKGIASFELDGQASAESVLSSLRDQIAPLGYRIETCTLASSEKKKGFFSFLKR